jgi:hypothetical protein
MDKTNFDLLSLAFGDRTVLDILKGVTGRNTSSLLCIEPLRETPLTKEEDEIITVLCEIRRCVDFVNQQTAGELTELDECGIYEKWGRILGLIKLNRTHKRDIVYSAFCKCVTAAYKYSASLGLDALAVVLQSRPAALFAISAHDKLVFQKMVDGMEDDRHEEEIRKAVQEIEEEEEDDEEEEERDKPKKRQADDAREIAMRKALEKLVGNPKEQQQLVSPIASRMLSARPPPIPPEKRPSWVPRSQNEPTTTKQTTQQTMHKSAMAKKTPQQRPKQKSVTWKNLRPSDDFERLLGPNKLASTKKK